MRENPPPPPRWERPLLRGKMGIVEQRKTNLLLMTGGGGGGTNLRPQWGPKVFFFQP